MIPKITENTITTYILEGLKNRGLNAEAFVSLKTPEGRREVDIFCKNGGSYVIEAKFKESDLWKAVGKIQNDYIKYHSTLGLNGGFALLYPDELSQPMLPIPKEILRHAKSLKFRIITLYLPEDTRKNFNVFEGSLDQIVEELSKQIIAPPDFIEPNVGYIINTLRDIARAITTTLKHLSGTEIEELLGGEHVFRNILTYDEGRYPVEDLRLASAYLLVNQLLFYNILSKKSSKEMNRDDERFFEELDSQRLTTPADLKGYFDKVLEVNYKVIFSYDVASRIPKNFLPEITTMIGSIQSLGIEKIGGDLLGLIFHNLIPFEVRKKVAAFYTDVMAAELLANLAVETGESKVADFASGSGGLLVAAYRRKKKLLSLERKFTKDDHKQFVEEDLLGVDVMPFAANVAASNLALQSPEFFTNRVNVAIWDSTDLVPNKIIPSIAHLQFVLTGQQSLVPYVDVDSKIQKGSTKLTKEKNDDIFLNYFDIVIMNPPFTRQERMPKEYKKKLVERFDAYKKYLDGRMSYYAYFILLADKFLKPDGKIALVLPASFLRTKSTKGIRKMLIERYELQYVITGKGRLNFSDATWKREILFIARKMKSGEKPANTNFVAIPSLPETSKEVYKLSQQIKEPKGEKDSTNNITFSSIDSKSLEADLDWFRFITSFQGEANMWDRILSTLTNLVRFGTLFDLNSIVKRGIETRSGVKVQPFLIPKNESRAIRKEDLWIAVSEDEKELTVCNKEITNHIVKIPKQSYIRGLRTTAGNSKMELKDDTDYVVTGDFKESETFFFGNRKELLEKLGKFGNYVSQRTGNIIIQRRFPIKARGLIHLCYYSQNPITSVGTTWIGNLPEDDAKILCLWFNSSFHLAQTLHERIEDVWIDVHKYQLEDLLIINPKKLGNRKKKALLKIFDELSESSFPSLELQYKNQCNEKSRLDKAILIALGVDDEKTCEELLSIVYEGIKTYFDSLTKMQT